MDFCKHLSLFLLIFGKLTDAYGITRNTDDSIYKPEETHYKINRPSEAYKVKTEITINTSDESEQGVVVCRSGVCQKFTDNSDSKQDNIKADVIVRVETRANLSSPSRRTDTPFVIGARGINVDPRRRTYPSINPNYDRDNIPTNFYGPPVYGSSVNFDSGRPNRNFADGIPGFSFDNRQRPNVYSSSIDGQTTSHFVREYQRDPRIFSQPAPVIRPNEGRGIVNPGYPTYREPFSHNLEPPVTYLSSDRRFPSLMPLMPRQFQDGINSPESNREAQLERSRSFMRQLPHDYHALYGSFGDASTRVISSTRQEYGKNRFYNHGSDDIELHRIPYFDPSHPTHQQRENSGQQLVWYPEGVNTYNPQEFKDIPERIPWKPSLLKSALNHYFENSQSFNASTEKFGSENYKCNTTSQTNLSPDGKM